MTVDLAALKREAAEHAVSFVESGMVLGLGHGSTTHYALLHLARRLREGAVRDVAGIPASEATAREARRLDIPLTTFAAHPAIDLTIDGADEVDPDLNLIKGGGGALLREKIIAQASWRVVIVVDETKLSPALGTRWAVPVEVLAFGWESQRPYLASLGAAVTPRVAAEDPGALFRTDEGNLILDCRFGPIAAPAALASRLDARVGIVEHGLFLGLASDVIVGRRDGVQHLVRAGSP